MGNGEGFFLSSLLGRGEDGLDSGMTEGKRGKAARKRKGRDRMKRESAPQFDAT